MFKITKRLNQARLGVLTTKHAKLATPLFMPVATRGVAKFISSADIQKLPTKIVLSNTYHLMLRPGETLIKKHGGLHGFMGWEQAILTDSGGFQVFSLAKGRNANGESLVKLSEKGVEFKSYVDGSKHFLTPERSLDIQRALGVDIAVCLDECVALPAERSYIEASVDLTSRWANRTKQHWLKLKGDKPLLFAVIQGGLDRDLRLRSLADLAQADFDGYNIGGLSVGETASEMYSVLDYLAPAMPEQKPRYLMGVGYPENIVEAVKRGVDMFDCVIPTREGRHGRLFFFKDSSAVKIIQALKSKSAVKTDFYDLANFNNAKWANDKKAINEASVYPELRQLSRAYLAYLFKINEPLAQRLASLNNLEFYLRLMELIRRAIK